MLLQPEATAKYPSTATNNQPRRDGFASPGLIGVVNTGCGSQREERLDKFAGTCGSPGNWRRRVPMPGRNSKGNCFTGVRTPARPESSADPLNPYNPAYLCKLPVFPCRFTSRSRIPDA